MTQSFAECATDGAHPTTSAPMPEEALAVVIYRTIEEARLETENAPLVPAPYGVLAEVATGALSRRNESAAVLAEAASLTVTTPADYLEALEVVKRAKTAGRAADDERKSYTEVINPVVKWINDQYRQAIGDATGKGTGAADIAWGKAQAYEREQQRIADEAAKKAREEQERAERKLREEAEAARVAEEAALRRAEEARAAGDMEAARIAEQEAARKAAVAERREEKAEVVAATPKNIPPATAGLRKGSGVGAGRKAYSWAFESADEAACLLKVIKAAADGNVAAIRCLTIDPSGARIQAQAGATVPGLRFGDGTASPSVRSR